MCALNLVPLPTKWPHPLPDGKVKERNKGSLLIPLQGNSKKKEKRLWGENNTYKIRHTAFQTEQPHSWQIGYDLYSRC